MLVTEEIVCLEWNHSLPAIPYSGVRHILPNCLSLLPQLSWLLQHCRGWLRPLQPVSSTVLAVGRHQKDTQRANWPRGGSGLSVRAGPRAGSLGSGGSLREGWVPTALQLHKRQRAVCSYPSNCIIVSWRIT